MGNYERIADQLISLILRASGSAASVLIGYNVGKVFSLKVFHFFKNRRSIKTLAPLANILTMFSILALSLVFAINNWYNDIFSVVTIFVFIAIALIFGVGETQLQTIQDYLTKIFTHYSGVRENIKDTSAGQRINRLELFNIGDTVEVVDGEIGKIRAIDDYFTVIDRSDGQTVIYPNRLIAKNKIVNYTAGPFRRKDFKLSVDYKSNVKKTKKVLGRIIETNSKIRKRPKPLIGVQNISENSISFLVRIYVNNKDYNQIVFELPEEVKYQFDKAKINLLSIT